VRIPLSYKKEKGYKYGDILMSTLIERAEKEDAPY